MPSEPCIYEGKIAEIATDLKNLKENFEEFKTNDFYEIKENIKHLIEKTNKPRLPMSITWILSVASGLIVGLGVALLKR